MSLAEAGMKRQTGSWRGMGNGTRIGLVEVPGEANGMLGGSGNWGLGSRLRGNDGREAGMAGEWCGEGTGVSRRG